MQKAHIQLEILYVFSVRIDTGQTFNNDKFKVCFNKGDTPIPYEPYKEHKKELLYKDTDGVWKKPLLYEWNTIEKHDDGKYYYHKRSEQIILNGSEDWILNQTLGNDKIQFLFVVSGIKTSKVICDRFQYLDNNESKESIWVYNNEKIVIHINTSKLETQNVAGFKKWLQTNPVTVIYKLMEEEVYECLPISVASYDNETIYRIESGDVSPVSSFELDYTLSNIVNRISDTKTYNNALKDNLKVNII